VTYVASGFSRTSWKVRLKADPTQKKFLNRASAAAPRQSLERSLVLWTLEI
jgi:hypothetical protein